MAPSIRSIAITERLARQASLPMPKVYVIPDPSPNAFATGRNPQHAAVAATQGILQVLNERELEGVIAHELAHVKHRDILISSIAATLAGAIMFAARMAMYAGMFGGGRSDDRDQGSNPIALLGMMILAPVAAMLIQAAISRSREFSADAGGAAIAGNPVRPGRRPAQDRCVLAPRAARRQSGDGAHVHHEPVLWWRAHVALQHASADRRAHPRADGRNLRRVRTPVLPAARWMFHNIPWVASGATRSGSSSSTSSSSVRLMRAFTSCRWRSSFTRALTVSTYSFGA